MDWWVEVFGAVAKFAFIYGFLMVSAVVAVVEPVLEAICAAWRMDHVAAGHGAFALGAGPC